MSLKYRLIALTVAVFAVSFGAGTLLGVQAARRLAEAQLVSRLANSAEALADSRAPLTDDVLKRFAPLLDAEILALDERLEVVAHSAADWDWQRIRSEWVRAVPGSGRRRLDTKGGRYYYGQASRPLAGTGEEITILMLADAGAVRGPTRTILDSYLIILAVTAAGLAVGMYLVGLGLVGRINRLNRRVDATLPEQAPGRRRGDEVAQLSEAFDDLLGRLERSRQRLTSQQRLATTGKIASSVAHEVRNPLQAMLLTLQMMREKCPPDLRDGCDLLLGEIDRLNLLTDELLVLAGKDTRRVEAVDLGRELRETLRLLQFQLRQRDVRAEINLAPLPPVRMDRNRCRQLFLNLLLNAAEASPRGGTVRVDGEARPAGAVVRIADNGPGFPEPVLAGKAEEFFSTKSSGAGLGLSICRRIVEEAGGQLKLYNTDAGAAAEVTLPVGDTSAH